MLAIIILPLHNILALFCICMPLNDDYKTLKVYVIFVMEKMRTREKPHSHSSDILLHLLMYTRTHTMAERYKATHKKWLCERERICWIACEREM